MYCKRCGTENADGMSFCRECGAPLQRNTEDKDAKKKNRSNYSTDYQNVKQEKAPEIRQFENSNTDLIPEEYKPISMWGYFGYELLFSIPLIGFILLLVFSFGGARNKNLRNFARSYFCFLILIIILALILAVCGVSLLRFL